MDKLAGVNGLVICQKKEWGEILTGFETRNKYVVADAVGNKLYYAAEVGGSFLIRHFFASYRPFEIDVVSSFGDVVFRLKRPFRFYFHEVDIYNANGKLIGKIEKRFSLLRRIYSVMDRHGQEMFELFGPILHPWTFEIRKDGVEYGKITKTWSGLLKEGFTDADNFGVTFPAEWEDKVKALLLGAVFLIDFVHFERKQD